MKISKKTRARIFLLIVMGMLVCACGAFGLVWTKQQINRSASAASKLELEIEELSRKTRVLDERIATLHQPVVLQGKVSGSLRPADDHQIVWVNPNINPDRGLYSDTEPTEAMTTDYAYTYVSGR